jgi:hypothetical protein
MKEGEYVRIGNLIKLRNATAILRNILSGEEWGVPQKEFSKAYRLLSNMEDNLRKMIKMEED